MQLLKYGPQSVLPEIFQNADDAYVEKSLMGNLSESSPVVIELTREYLRFAHVGRPINDAGRLPDTDRRRKDFRRDVVKMLTLNFSDKERTDANATETLTGKFGLGFKSVYFLTDRPEVWSAPLRFSVIGGIYPDNVRSDILHLDAVAEEFFPGGKHSGTVFHLPIEDNYAEANDLVTEFYNQAVWFLLFSKRITQIKFIGDIDGVFSKENVRNIGEEGSIRLYPKTKESLLVLDCSEAMNKAQAVLVLQDRKAKAPDSRIARLWVTTPLADAMDASWVINAPFEPDAGRSHISWRDTKNREKAAAFSANLHQRLVELFDQVGQHPEVFGTAYEFWLSLWRLFRTKSSCFDWSDLLTSGTIHSWLCWAQGSGAYRQLCETRAVIPSGLPGQLGSLLQVDQILYRLHGDFANYPRILETLALWEGFDYACPRARTVSSEIANDLLVHFQNLSLEEVRLVDCLRAEIPRNAPIAEQAIERFQGLAVLIKQITDHAWKKRQLEAFEEIFLECRFKAQDGGARKIADLLIPIVGERETMLLKDIAPQSRLLSSDYSSYEDFLVRFVTSLKPELDIIEQWAHESSDERLSAVFEYLLKGEKRQALADRLKVSWFESNKNSPEHNQLGLPQQNELRRLFMSEESGANLETLIRVLEGGTDDDESDVDVDVDWIIEESLSLEKLIEFWEESGDQEPYTLTGAWWESLTENIEIPAGGTRECVLHDLLVKDCPSCRLLWYRIFAIGTFVSANRRSRQLHDFLEESETLPEIWNAVDSDAYRESVDVAFEAIVGRDVPNERASQENAIFWRRVFYDLRKIHYLIFENELHLALMDLIWKNQIPFNEMAAFLRSGRLRDGQVWKGTLGESMNAPILFILRELHRIGLFKGRSSAPRPLFFSRYTIHAFSVLGLSSSTKAPGFDGAFELSKRLEESVYELKQDGKVTASIVESFLNAYDMPFLHYVLSHKKEK